MLIDLSEDRERMQALAQVVYPLQLGTAAGSADTMLLVDNLSELPEGGTFVGIIDRGTHTEEKVLCKRSKYPGYLEAVRAWDGTLPLKHAAFSQSQEALNRAVQLSVQMQQMFGMGMISKSMLDPHRLERMEAFVFAPISEWIAEGEKKAVREWEAELV